MLLSIIIPYYNADAWIGKMLDSLLDQDLDPSEYEIIVVDDGSEEEPVVLKDYAAHYPQIAYHRIPHGGMSAGRNYGLSVAKGEWVHFCDSDDFVQPQVYGGIIRAAQERNLEMIVARFVMLEENDPIPTPRRVFSSSETMSGVEYLVKGPKGFTWALWSMLVKRSVVEAIGLSFEDIYYVEDRLFKFALLQAVTRMATIDVDLYYYVQHESSVFHVARKRNNPEFIDAWLVYMDRLISCVQNPSTSPELTACLKRRLQQSAFYVLSNAFVYSPLQVNVSSMSRLAAWGLYPVEFDEVRDTRHIRTIKRLMNHRRLWLCLHRVFHLLPERFIYKHFQV